MLDGDVGDGFPLHGEGLVAVAFPTGLYGEYVVGCARKLLGTRVSPPPGPKKRMPGVVAVGGSFSGGSAKRYSISESEKRSPGREMEIFSGRQAGR